ncbi:hypothetical protein H9Q13_12920 [Pontibacter sp. JH31]|uniref:GMT-like wHTH domain-containing protein n=2 Tax=Pontibacter aquaedesilientis TaxID=2766980 RepID=A0ABR7XIF1_9BACT|nr:hypothetical protein [Pontibacter aquaedesilientis]
MDLQAGLDIGEAAPTAPQVLRQVYKSTGSRTDLNKGVSTILYDVDQPALAELQEKVEQLPFYHDLVHPPLTLQEADDEALAAQMLEQTTTGLAFLDPTIEGLSQRVLLQAVQTGIPDLLMLFNPKAFGNTIKRAKADSLWQQLFGERLDKIKAFYKQNRQADRREEYLLDCFEEIFQSHGFYTLRFRINFPDKKQTSHYVVFGVKSEQAYLRLKELLARYSDYQEDGVPLFGANLQVQQLSLFQEHYKYSVTRLAQELAGSAGRYSNRSLQYIYESHSISTPYTLANYTAAFEKLMKDGLVRFINPKTGQAITKLTPVSLIRYKK